MSVGHYRLAVTANVFEIICSRAFFLKARLVWIDAVCINQTDIPEETGQIQLMRAIYQQAFWVIVWLGSSPDATKAMDFISILYSKMHRYDLGDEELKYMLAVGSKSPRWPEFFNLPNHPYWTRVWIIQEVAAATHFNIYYGRELISWDMLISVIRRFDEENTGTIFTPMQKFRCQNLFSLKGCLKST
jgi:hypothetical protein